MTLKLRFQLVLLLVIIMLVGLLPSQTLTSIQAQDSAIFKPINILGGRGAPIDMQWSPDGDMLAVSSGQSMWLYDKNLEDIRTLELPQVDELGIFESISGGQLAWSPDGTQLAAGSGYYVPSVRGRNAYIWDAQSGQLVHKFVRKEGNTFDVGAAQQMAWSPDGTQIAGISQSEVWVWDAASGDTLLEWENQFQLFDDFQWNADNTLQIFDARELAIVTWDALTGEFIDSRSVNDAYNLTFVVAPDGSKIAEIDTLNASIIISDRSTGNELNRIELLTEQSNLPIFGQWSADSTQFVSYIRTRQPQLQVWDLATGKQLFAREFNSNATIETVALSPDNKTLVLNIGPGILEAWNLDSAEKVATRWVSIGVVSAIAWSPDSKRLVSASADDTAIRLWDVEASQPVQALEGHQGWTFAVDWSPDGRYIASGDASTGLAYPSTVIIWDGTTAEEIRRLPIENTAEDYGFIAQLAWSSDSQQLAVVRDSNTIGRTFLRVFDIATFEQIYALDSDRARVKPITWSSDNQRILAGVTASPIPLLFDDGTRTHNAWMRFNISTDDIEQEVASTETIVELDGQPQGDLLATAESGMTNALRFWDGMTGELRFSVENQPERYTAMAWNTTGDLVAVATFATLTQPIVEIWQISEDDAVLIDTLYEHLSFGAGINGLAWSPNGQMLASAGDDGKIIIWQR